MGWYRDEKAKIADRVLALHRQGVPNPELALRFGISTGSVNHIIKREVMRVANAKRLAGAKSRAALGNAPGDSTPDGGGT